MAMSDVVFPCVRLVLINAPQIYEKLFLLEQIFTQYFVSCLEIHSSLARIVFLAPLHRIVRRFAQLFCTNWVILLFLYGIRY